MPFWCLFLDSPHQSTYRLKHRCPPTKLSNRIRHVRLPYLSEFEIIDVVFQEIGHGSHHTGLSCPGRPVQQVTPLPSPPRSLIKGFVIPERRQVRNNFLLQARVHRERVERRRMLVRDRIPQAPRPAHHEMVVPTFLVGENLDLACFA